MCWRSWIFMGCISSKRDTCPTVFHVVNVDDAGRQLNAGQLEVTDVDLIFYQRGKPPIRWPLKYLRRYGHDVNHFSFESGRRCPTGPGVYAFHCRRAEEVVELLEAKLQVHDENQRISQRLSSSINNGLLSPIVDLNPLIESFPVPPPASRPVSQNIYANDQAIVNALNPSTRLSTTSQDETNNNTSLETGFEHTYANTLLGGSDNDEVNVPSHLYMNIVPGTKYDVPDYRPQPPPPEIVEWEQEEPPHEYANLDLESELEIPRVAPVRVLTKPVLNYIVLDLEPGGEAPPRSPSDSLPPDSPRKPPLGYATIDFDKTSALSHSVDPAFDDSDCSRKTRHSSSIILLPRNSSSLSE